MSPQRVILLRGTAANPWDLRPWQELRNEFDVRVAVPPNNLYETETLGLRRVGVRTVGGRLERAGPLGHLGLRAVGERYLGLGGVLAGADLVHSAELGTWFSAQAAALRQRLGFRLVVTVWETLPFLEAYRNLRTRPYRRRVLEQADLFLPATQRAREALLLEGVAEERIRVCPPGIGSERPPEIGSERPPEIGSERPPEIGSERPPGIGSEPPPRSDSASPPDGSPGGNHSRTDQPTHPHEILSVGRLVWEKGHQDVLRAVARLRRRRQREVRVSIVGQGPERGRLARLIDDLELNDVVELRGWLAHAELAALYRRASCLVLASLPTWYWEEQFGMVLVEALAAHLPVIAAGSGAIPEVVQNGATLFTAGDWIELAETLERGPLARPPGERKAPPPELMEHYSVGAAAARLRAVYRELTGAPDG